ncbi:glycosyltransferase [Aestuariivirga sp.]|uniref:CgeB family protein n=1 Tax=Aestuariivirga sp. TaxID=2650926 RepID=UPI00391D0398
MKIVYFTHALSSCWNHGNAHFLRGVLRELVHAGHDVRAYEPEDSWSHDNLVREHGEAAGEAWRRHYPELSVVRMGRDFDPGAALDQAELVIVHEWNTPELVARIGAARRNGGRFTLLFHDTHHRAVSEPDAIRHFDLESYDGVLAFGEALAAVYRRWGWGSNVFVWHEAADTRLFRPPEQEGGRQGAVWIGNWGDGERETEITDYLLRPAQAAGLPLDIHGVRYPRHALEAITRHGAHYRGWLPNVEVPAAFARHLATVHVPRRFYVETLPGIPTIRVFEALACGIPLVSAPWEDSEQLFTAGTDYLLARSGGEMAKQLRAIATDPDLRQSLTLNGLAAIHARHSCHHRMHELLAIAQRLGATTLETA